MSVIDKKEFKSPHQGVVSVNNKEYIADKVVLFPVVKEKINFDNCTCIFSILERPFMQKRQYIGAKFYENLNNENVIEEINGYLPECIFCFIDTYFPLEEFLNMNDFE